MAARAAPSYVSVATCDADAFELNGGGNTHPDICGRAGFLHTSMPQGNGRLADAFDENIGDGPAGDICSQAFATCCKFQ